MRTSMMRESSDWAWGIFPTWLCRCPGYSCRVQVPLMLLVSLTCVQVSSSRLLPPPSTPCSVAHSSSPWDPAPPFSSRSATFPHSCFSTPPSFPSRQQRFGPSSPTSANKRLIPLCLGSLPWPTSVHEARSISVSWDSLANSVKMLRYLPARPSSVGPAVSGEVRSSPLGLRLPPLRPKRGLGIPTKQFTHLISASF